MSRSISNETDNININNSSIMKFFRNNLNEISLIIGLVILSAFFSSQSGAFLTKPNIINILRSASFLAIVTWGMTFVIIAGEIDVSVGPAVAFSSVLVGWLSTKNNIPFITSIFLVFLTTTFFSFIGGYVRAKFNVPSFVTTLAFFSIFDGLKQVLSNNMPIPVDSGNFNIVATGTLWGIPYPIIIAFVLFLLFRYIAKNTVYGRSIYSVGGNANAAYASGINVKLIRTSVFMITGFLSALTGLLHVARLGTATGAVASGLEFSSIAAVVIGGTSLSGGRGTMFGSLIGLLFISVISNGLVLMGVASTAQGIVRGTLILIAVLMNVIFKKENKRI